MPGFERMEPITDAGFRALRRAAIALAAAATIWTTGCVSPLADRMSPLGKSAPDETKSAKSFANDSFPTAAEVGLANNDDGKKADK